MKNDPTNAWNRLRAMAGVRDTVATRALLERPPVPPTDGRRARSKGRTKQLNVNVCPSFHAKLKALAAAEHLGVADLLERLVATYEEARTQKGAPR